MNAGRGTTGCQELEARRIKMALAEISKSWWWFEEGARLAHANNDAAWQWELLRRSNVYRKFYTAAAAIRVQDKAGPSPAGFADRVQRGPRHRRKFPRLPLAIISWMKLRALAGSISRLGDREPCHKWTDLFHARCAPPLFWTALPEKSRNVVASLCPLYPRAEIAAAFTPGIDLQVEAIIVKRLPSGQEELTPLTPASSVILGRYQAAELLPAILPEMSAFGVYVVVIFDVRNAEFTLTSLKKPNFLSRFTAILQNTVTRLQAYLRETNQTPPTPRLSLAGVFGSNQPFWCQAWTPIDALSDATDVLSRFRTLIGSRQRQRWLPECEMVWRKLFPSHLGDSAASLKTKRSRIKDARDMQAGLCAYDCRKIETRFTQSGLLIPFLRECPNFQSFADPDRLHAVLLQVRQIIEKIDSSYGV